MDLNQIQTSVVIILGGALLVMGFIAVKGITEATLSKPPAPRQPQEVQLNLSVLKSDPLQDLILFSHIQKTDEETFGRDNPFQEQVKEEATSTKETSE